MTKNIYYLRARLAPTVLTAIPALVLLVALIHAYYSELNEILSVLPFLTGLGLSAAIIFLSTQVNRMLAKEIFQRALFNNDEFQMPTTTHLMLKDKYYENSIKEKIRTKIASKFDIQLLDAESEKLNPTGARKVIAAGVAQIRVALHGNSKLLQHNYEYGFWRNLIGGSLLAVLFSGIIFFYGWYQDIASLKSAGIILFCIYMIPIVLSGLILRRYAEYYSKILFEEFIAL